MRNFKKIFIGLLILFSASTVIFAEESKKNNLDLENKGFVVTLDGEKIYLYFCDDGYVLLKSNDEYVVAKYVFNEKYGIGAITDPECLSEVAVVIKYDKKSNNFFIEDIDNNDKVIMNPLK